MFDPGYLHVDGVIELSDDGREVRGNGGRQEGWKKKVKGKEKAQEKYRGGKGEV
jgi:hypothetical protein